MTFIVSSGEGALEGKGRQGECGKVQGKGYEISSLSTL
jgi:hypothetical protein